MGISQPHHEEGKLTVAYTDASGQSLAVQFSAITSHQATYLIGNIFTATSGDNSQYIASEVSSDATVISMGNIEGAGNMEERLAILMNEVSHIKTSVNVIEADVRKMSADVAELKTGMNVVLQKLSVIEQGLSSKADEKNVDIRINTIEKALDNKPSKAEAREIVSNTQCSIIKWVIGTVIASSAVIIGALKFFLP
ncbi:hypothetical protein [Kosakonia sacchari]|uniref:hypothetical protein n=1 Tax=Kosakonia sacchari TaxID=1158459 RepID=UPI001584F9F5|nr:hypothetical protein [Kosakonia sacchari]NUL36657.1 hypothetical protein [Kosakonia sacchari]